MPEQKSMDEEEHQRRQRRKDAYHLSAGHYNLPSADDDDTDYLFRFLTQASREFHQLKTDLVRELAKSGGDVDTPGFVKALENLQRDYDPSAHVDVRERKADHLGGMWLTLNKPKFPDCIGKNSNGEYMYTLGKMAWDMFRPSDLAMSIQGTFNPVHYVSRSDREAIEQVPKSLKNEIRHGSSVLRTYDVVTACTIEPRSSVPASPSNIAQRPIKALMTNYGYALPNPDKPNRLSVWFTGGTLEMNDLGNMQQWRSLFESPPRRPFQAKARLLTARVVMGASPGDSMEADGKMKFTFERPIGGHGKAFVDILYLDETLRIVRGTRGDVYVFARVPSFPDE